MNQATKPPLILKALFDYVDAFATGIGFKVAWPDRQFEPDTTGQGQMKPYLVVTMVGNGLAWEGLSSGRIDQGVLQLSVVYPAGSGAVAPAGIVGQIIDAFPKGMPIQAEDVTVKVSRQAYGVAPIPGDDRTSYPVIVAWTA